MRKFLACLLAAALLPDLSLTASSRVSDDIPPPSILLPHPPILVESDLDFKRPGSGVLRGAGTPDNPYVIEGWLIPALGARPFVTSGIRIRNTSAHVIIQHNLVQGGFGGSGIALVNASNVQLRDNDLGPGLSFGLYAAGSRNISAMGNRLADVVVGVAALYTEQLTVVGNSVSCNLTASLPGVQLAAVVGAVVQGNDIRCHEGPGIHVFKSRSVQLNGNRITQSTYGVTVEGTSDLVVQDNRLESNKGISLELAGVSGFRVEHNVVDSGTGGISLGISGSGPHGSTVINNTVTNTPRNAFLTKGYPKPFNIAFENNSVDGRPVLAYRGLRDTTLDGSGKLVAYLIIADSENVEVKNWRISSLTPRPFQVVNGASIRIHSNELHDGGGLLVVYGSENVVEDNRLWNISGPAIEVGSARAVVRGNHVGNSTTGIELRFVSLEYGRNDLPVAENALVTGNHVDSIGTPLRIKDTPFVTVENNRLGPMAVAVHGSRGLVLRGNSLLAGHIYAAQSGWPLEDFGPIDARWNWWGTESGPGNHEIPWPNEVEIWDEPWLIQPLTET